jgi:glycosyltransferase involved in cell wall biosynthesis
LNIILKDATEKIIDQKNIKRADLILANSNFTRINIKNAYGTESLVNYMGVDAEIFKPKKITKNIDILFIGAYETADGLNLLEMALKKIDKKINIKVLASEKQWITNDKQIRDLYCQAKIVLSLAHSEPFGLIPLEAMACGIPVIAVNEGGYRETVIDSRTGYLVPRNPEILAQKINLLLTDTKLRSEFSKNARELMLKKWTWDIRTKELEKTLQKFV